METTRQPRGTAVWVLPLDSSGCGACTQQIYALLSPQYAAQMRARGVSLARSPRHADVVLITGALSETARAPIERVLASVPQPRALVAVGNCAIDGCVFRGSPYLTPSAAETLDVNVEIAGCPPNPQAILDAISQAAQLLYSETDADSEDDDTTEADTEMEAAEVDADVQDTAKDDADTSKDEAEVTNKAETEPASTEDSADRGEAPSDRPRASRNATKRRGGSR